MKRRKCYGLSLIIHGSRKGDRKEISHMANLEKTWAIALHSRVRLEACDYSKLYSKIANSDFESNALFRCGKRNHLCNSINLKLH